MRNRVIIVFRKIKKKQAPACNGGNEKILKFRTKSRHSGGQTTIYQWQTPPKPIYTKK